MESLMHFSNDHLELNSYAGGKPPDSCNNLGISFEKSERYRILEIIGSGAYGIVARGMDERTGSEVAIKKLEQAFKSTSRAKNALRELTIMQKLQHDNILTLKDVYFSLDEELYIVTELMDCDLRSVIQSSQDLTEDHCKILLYQILRGLKFISESNILHRDLKPHNLLCNSNCDLKIGDFGMARPINRNLKSSCMTDFVSTLWYRAPELLLASKQYTPAIDIWSVGTIFAEMLIRRPLFPGVNTNHQLDLIFNVLGTPSMNEINAFRNPRIKEKLKRINQRKPVPLASIVGNLNHLGLDLLKQMLEFNPSKRISVQDALRHPYFADLHQEEDLSATVIDFSYEGLSIEELKTIASEVPFFKFS